MPILKDTGVHEGSKNVEVGAHLDICFHGLAVDCVGGMNLELVDTQEAMNVRRIGKDE